MNTAHADHESLISGEETVEKLRELIRAGHDALPLVRNHERCPFSLFRLLDPQVLHNFVQTTTIEARQHFFEVERECRIVSDWTQSQSLHATSKTMPR